MRVHPPRPERDARSRRKGVAPPDPGRSPRPAARTRTTRPGTSISPAPSSSTSSSPGSTPPRCAGPSPGRAGWGRAPAASPTWRPPWPASACSTSLAAAFGDDHYGDYCWDALEHGEGIDLSPSRTVPGWHSPVTVSMAYEGERTMVSHGHEPPPEEPAPALPAPRARAAVASLAPGVSAPWIAQAAGKGTRVFGDVGWDDTGAWDLAGLPDLRHCEAFLPNAQEAMRYTGADCPRAAAHALTEYVPLAVVTLGAEGPTRWTGGRGRPPRCRPSRSRRSTRPGRGTCSSPGSSTGTLADWPLADRLAFAGLTAALSVQEFGGSLSAPGLVGDRGVVAQGPVGSRDRTPRRCGGTRSWPGLCPRSWSDPGRCGGLCRRSVFGARRDVLAAQGARPAPVKNPAPKTPTALSVHRRTLDWRGRPQLRGRDEEESQALRAGP